MGQVLQTLSLDDATLHGNVELKSAVGTLPERLTIEKMISTYNLNDPVNSGSRSLWLTNGKLFIIYNGYAPNGNIRRFNPDTMMQEASQVDSSLNGYRIFGADDTYIYAWKGYDVKKIYQSDLTVAATFTGIRQHAYGAPVILYGDYLYNTTSAVSPTMCKVFSKVDGSFVEEFELTTYNYNSILGTPDGEYFYYGYTALYRYQKSTQESILITGQGHDLSGNFKMDYGNPVAGENTPDRVYMYGGRIWYFTGRYMLSFAYDGSDVKVEFMLPVKTDFLMYVEGQAGCHWNDTYLFLSTVKGFMNLIKILWGDNSFENSFAEWDVSSISNIKKIIINGGFNKGYGDSYADAKNIKVSWFEGGLMGQGWKEYDIDTMPNINWDNIPKIKIGLKDRYLGNDRLPYISGLSVLCEDTVAPAMPTNLVVDLPPNKPTGLELEDQDPAPTRVQGLEIEEV